MNVELITHDDLLNFKRELLKEIEALISEKKNQTKKWLKAVEVRKLLNISPNTLVSLRVNGTLPYTKVGGIIYFDYDDIKRLMHGNMRNKPEE